MATTTQDKASKTHWPKEDFAHIDVPSQEEVAEAQVLGHPGKPLNSRNPFLIGLTGSLGIAVTYILFKTIVGTGEVLSLVGLALFLAVGLDPAVVWLSQKGLSRGVAVGVVVTVITGVVVLFVVTAVGPISREIHAIQVNEPKWRSEIEHGKGPVGHLAQRLHLTSELKSSKITKVISPAVVAGGLVGAGKLVISAVSATVVVVVLTIYFLVALPAVRRLWLRLIPKSRRLRTAGLTDEILSRVGGFVLGNLLTSLVAGVGTWLWLTAFGVPYPIVLGLLVALLDLIPIVGSTIGGIIVSGVALSVSVPVAVGTLVFYILYRFFEDYLLTPRVMRHTVRISPGITIIAILVGGVLLGLIGALIAIPTAAGIQLLLEEVAFPSLEKR